jgi:predicted dehydrogenase
LVLGLSPDTNEDMIELAVIGAGLWGPNLIRTFHRGAHARVRWVVDPDPGARQRVVQRHPDIRGTATLAEALEDPAVSAVAVATPTATHYAIGLEAIAHGKHLFVEKPLTADADEADELTRRARDAGLTLMVGHVFVHNPGVELVRRLLAEGALGRLSYISMIRTNQGPVRGDVSAAWDLASHDISMVLRWLDTDPLSVSAVGGAWTPPRHGSDGVPRADAVFTTLTYPNDVLVNLHVSWLNPGKVRDVTLVGDRALVSFDDTRSADPVRVYRKSAPDACTRDLNLHVPDVPGDEPLRAQCDRFIDAIQTGRSPISDGAFGARVVRVIEAIERSMTLQGAPLHLG